MSSNLLCSRVFFFVILFGATIYLAYFREYKEAVRELSICMAFAPEDEAEVLEPFVEKLHLLRLESSWKSLGHKGSLQVT